MIAAGSNNAFAINGFGGLTTTEIFSFFIVQPLLGFAEFARLIDLYVVDGLVDLIGQVPRFVGQVFRPIQNGLTQFYGLAMALGMTVFLVALVWRLAW